MSTFISKATIKDWQAAFEAANGKPAPSVTYDGGWYRIANSKAYRLAQMLTMIDNLNDRIAARRPPHSPAESETEVRQLKKTDVV